MGRNLGEKNSDPHGGGDSGSRFAALKVNQAESKESGLNMAGIISMNNNTLNVPTKENNPKSTMAKAKPRLKFKGKGIVIGSGSKKNGNVLKPSNKGYERRPESFNDGSVMCERVG